MILQIQKLKGAVIVLLACLSLQFFPSSYAIAQTWMFHSKNVAPDRNSGDNLGWSVALLDSTAFAGSPYNRLDENGQNDSINAGAVYVYNLSANGEWSFSQKLVAPDRTEGDQFGFSVAAATDLLIVGAYSKIVSSVSGNYIKHGCAYIFRKSSTGLWQFEQKLTASDGRQQDIFGWDVDIEGDWAIVGSGNSSYDSTGSNYIYKSGAAYIYHFNSSVEEWSEYQKIYPNIRGYEALFGSSVAIDGGRIVVGAYRERYDVTGQNLTGGGAIYTFELNNSLKWEQQQKLVASDRAGGDGLGWSIDFKDNLIISGAPFNDYDEVGADYHNNSGAVYIFTRNQQGNWGQSQKIVSDERWDNIRFGFSLSVDERNLFISTFQNRLLAFVEDSTNHWGLSQRVASQTPTSNGWFGRAISANSGRIISGSPQNSSDQNQQNQLIDAGAVWFFRDSLIQLSITSDADNHQINCYPNPATNSISLTGNKLLKSSFRVEVLSIYGGSQMVGTYLPQERIDLQIDDLAAGIYILKIIWEDFENQCIRFQKR